MGEGGLKQAFVNLGRLAHQVLHGLPLLPGLFDQGFKRSAIVLRLSLQSLRRGLKQTSSKLKGLFLERKGIIYGRLVASKISWTSCSVLPRSIICIGSFSLFFRFPELGRAYALE